MMATADALVMARMQFAANMTFHILFPAISIGLSWLLLYFRLRANSSKAALTGDAHDLGCQRVGADERLEVGGYECLGLVAQDRAGDAATHIGRRRPHGVGRQTAVHVAPCVGDEVGRDRAGTDQAYADAGALELHPQGIAEGLEGELGRAVTTQRWCGDVRRHRPDIYDPAAAALEHAR